VVERMKAQKVAGVLAAMDAKVAKQITTELASRQSLPLEQEGES
jgi:flagellar motility protein MotE (MotC chaperone)